MRMQLSLLAFAVSAVLAQRPARIGPDGKPLLNRPVLEECQKRKFPKYSTITIQCVILPEKWPILSAVNGVIFPGWYHQVFVERKLNFLFYSSLQESLTCNGADTITSCLGGSPGTSLRIGTGSTDATFAGTDAWTWSVLIPRESTSSSPPSCVKVSSNYHRAS